MCYTCINCYALSVCAAERCISTKSKILFGCCARANKRTIAGTFGFFFVYAFAAQIAYSVFCVHFSDANRRYIYTHKHEEMAIHNDTILFILCNKFQLINMRWWWRECTCYDDFKSSVSWNGVVCNEILREWFLAPELLKRRKIAQLVQGPMIIWIYVQCTWNLNDISLDVTSFLILSFETWIIQYVKISKAVVHC